MATSTIDLALSEARPKGNDGGLVLVQIFGPLFFGPHCGFLQHLLSVGADLFDAKGNLKRRSAFNMRAFERVEAVFDILDRFSESGGDINERYLKHDESVENEFGFVQLSPW